MSYQEDINDHLWTSIFVTLCCCLIPGIVGIVHSATARSRREAGDYQGAVDAANAAFVWDMWGIGLGLAAGLIKILIEVSRHSY